MANDAFEKAREAAVQAGLSLSYGEAGLVLSDGRLSLTPDFTHMARRLRPENLRRELLVRAAKVKTPGRKPGSRPGPGFGPGPEPATGLRAIDATAGLGEDSLILAAAGFAVTMYERNPVIAALLADALRRAAEVPGLADVAGRMRVLEGDGVEALLELAGGGGPAPEVVLLDPMFPTKQKPSAVKKKLQLIQRLERPCEDEGALLDAALAVRPRKVVVKRPAKGRFLAGRKPSYSLSGKAVRFDCYAGYVGDASLPDSPVGAGPARPLHLR